MTSIRRILAVLLTASLLLGLSLSSFAALGEEHITDPVQQAIEEEARVGRGTVTVELNAGTAINAVDWAALKDTGKTFCIKYHTTSYTFANSDVSRTLGYDSLNLGKTTNIPEELVEAICDKTGLEEDEFMLVMPGMLGKLPGNAKIGICLDADFVDEYGTSGLNLYGIDFGKRTDSSEEENNGKTETVYTSRYYISSIGLAASGLTAGKSYSPWFYINSNVSRLMLITKKTISTSGSMSWTQSSGGMTTVQEVAEADNAKSTTAPASGVTTATDANPNTGAVENLRICLTLAIVAVSTVSVVILVRSLRVKKH